MIYSLLYVFVFSFGLVLIQKLDLSIPPLFSLLVTATIATLYFNLINTTHLKKIYSDCLNNKKNWFFVMLIVLVMWATTMIGPGKIGASMFNFIYFAWLGILGLISAGFKDGKTHSSKLYFSVCILTLIIANVFFELRVLFSSDILMGIIFALIGGTASFIYVRLSQNLAKTANLTATQVLAVRFYFALIVLMILLPKNQIQENFNLFNLGCLILLAFCSLIAPLYFSQKALEKISSEQHAIVNSLCPIITGILQEILFRDLQKEQIIIYFLYTLIITSIVLLEKRHKRLALIK